MKCKYCKNKVPFFGWFLFFNRKCFPCYKNLLDIELDKEAEKLEKEWENSYSYWRTKK